MYVLADLEWVENQTQRISFTQIAMVRVDENWQPVSTIHRRICPLDPSFHIWDHMAFNGGSALDFLAAPDSPHAFGDVVNWLCTDDIICWWHPESMERFQKIVPAIANKQLVLVGPVENRLGGRGMRNVYRIGKNLSLARPKPQHDSRNDIEMMRRVLAHLQFPRPIPEDVPENFYEDTYKQWERDQASVQGMAYHAHVATNIIHKKGCPKIPSIGRLKGYNELSKPVKKGYIPCDCIKAEFRAARQERNQSTIDRAEYSFLYTPDSDVFHRRDCKVMLNAKEIKGAVRYNTCVSAGRRPCKICKPDATVSAPIRSAESYSKAVKKLKELCNRAGFRYWEEAGRIYIETEVGIWRLNPGASPYPLEHINLTRTAGNRTKFHRQPRILRSLQDAFYYIKRHDKALASARRKKGYELPQPLFSNP